MASLNGFRGNIAGASGSQGLLGPKGSWSVYIFPRGGHASADSTGTTITFDSASVASRFTANHWVQVGTDTSKIRQISSISSNTIVLTSSVTCSTGNRIFNIGATQPTVTASLATYTSPNSTIYPRDDNGSTAVSNSKLTTDSDGTFEFWAANGLYDAMVQDSDGTNQLGIVDIQVGPSSLFQSGAGWINVEDYGAVHDASTDDATAIQNALNAIGSDGGTLYFPPGDYYIATGVSTATQGVVIRGAGGAGVGNIPDAASAIISDQAIAMFGFGTVGSFLWNGPAIYDLSFRDSSAGNDQVTKAIRVAEMGNLHFQNVNFANIKSGTAIELDAGTGNVQYGVFENLRMKSCLIGINMIGGVNAINLIGGYYDGGDLANSTGIVHGSAGDSLKIIGTAIQDFTVGVSTAASYDYISGRFEQVDTTNIGIGVRVGGLNTAVVGSAVVGLSTAIDILPGANRTLVLGNQIISGLSRIVDGGTSSTIIDDTGGYGSRWTVGYARGTAQQEKIGFFVGQEANTGNHPFMITPSGIGVLVKDSFNGYSGGLFLAGGESTAVVGFGVHQNNLFPRASGTSASYISFQDDRMHFRAGNALTAGNVFTSGTIARIHRAGFDLGGTALGLQGTSGFTFTSTWGDAATVTFTTCTNQRGRVTLSSAGTGQGAGAEVGLKFSDGGYPTSTPIAVCARGDTSSPTTGNFRSYQQDTSGVTFRFDGLPVSGNTYAFTYIVMGTI